MSLTRRGFLAALVATPLGALVARAVGQGAPPVAAAPRALAKGGEWTIREGALVGEPTDSLCRLSDVVTRGGYWPPVTVVRIEAGASIRPGDALAIDEECRAIPLRRAPAGRRRLGFALEHGRMGEPVRFTMEPDDVGL